MHGNMKKCMERKDNQITKGYNSIRSSREISITKGDQYIKESQLARLVASKRFIFLS